MGVWQKYIRTQTESSSVRNVLELFHWFVQPTTNWQHYSTLILSYLDEIISYTHFLDITVLLHNARSGVWVYMRWNEYPFHKQTCHFRVNENISPLTCADQSHKHQARLFLCTGEVCAFNSERISITASHSRANHTDRVPTWVTPTLISAVTHMQHKHVYQKVVYHSWELITGLMAVN